MTDTTITSEHLKLAESLEWRWEDCEYGAPAVDCKRPYGNSDVERDIAETLGWTLVETRDGPELTRQQAERARGLHADMLTIIPALIERGIASIRAENQR